MRPLVDEADVSRSSPGSVELSHPGEHLLARPLPRLPHMSSRSSIRRKAILLAVTAVFASSVSVQAQALRGDAGFATSLLPQDLASFVNDVPLPFAANFFGNTSGTIGINQHGYITFGPMTDFAGAIGLFITPLNANVDTREPWGTPVSYGGGSVDGRPAFGINWLAMLEFDPFLPEPAPETSSFQLVLIDRSDVATGDFDFEMNYGAINWPDRGYLGGFGEGCLYAPGDPFCPPGTPVQIPIIPDGNPSATTLGSLNSTVAGRYRYGVRGGSVITTGLDPVSPEVVPEPATISLLLLGLGVLGGVAVRTRRRD
jgi:hypothetical protein